MLLNSTAKSIKEFWTILKAVSNLTLERTPQASTKCRRKSQDTRACIRGCMRCPRLISSKQNISAMCMITRSILSALQHMPDTQGRYVHQWRIAKSLTGLASNTPQFSQSSHRVRKQLTKSAWQQNR